MNETEKVGSFTFDQKEISKLRLAQKEVILRNVLTWRIGFSSRSVRRFESHSSSDTKSDSSLKIDGSPMRKSTPSRKRPVSMNRGSLSKTVRKKLHLEKILNN